jgi:hypothetical protein
MKKPVISDSYDIKPSSKPAVKGLREWQARGLKVLGDAQFTFTTAPCGSGKSTFQVELGVRELIRTHFQQKQLFVVPQSHIGGSFSNHAVKVGQKSYTWAVTSENTFCDSSNTVQRLKAWLLTPPATLLKGFDGKTINRVAAVCSYATLVLAFGSMSDAEKRKAYKNLSLHIDEAHHVNGLVEDGEKATQEQNQLSKVCQDALNGLGHKTTCLHMTTATPMRGDRDIILTEKAKQRFKHFNVNWEEWLPELGIKQINIRYQDYDSVPALHANVLHHLKKDINAGRKVWIMIPPTGIGWRKKKQTYKPMVDAISKLKGVHLQNFVPFESDRDMGHLHPDAKTNVLVTCSWGREGTDWIANDTVYNLMLDKSVTVAVQKWGRPLRKYAKKTSVDIVNFVSFPKKVIAGKSVRETLSDHSNSLLASMVMGSNLTGGLLADMSKFSAEDQHKIMEIEKEYIQDVSAAILKDKMDLEDVEGSEDFGDVDDETGSAVKKLQKKTTDKLMAMTMPPSDMLRLQGFDRINQMAESFMSGTYGKGQLGQIRKLMEESQKTVEEWVTVAEKLAQENGGKVPAYNGLKSKKYSSLYHAMLRHPGAFCHLSQEKRKKNLTECVEIATTLANDNGGTLKSQVWLRMNGHVEVASAITRHPDAFSHLGQEKQRKTVAEHVNVAEFLRKNNGGILPSTTWLISNGHSDLYNCLKAHPKAFSHLTQEKIKKVLEEHVADAEHLCKTHGGSLPSPGWLRNNGYADLYTMVHKRPDAFAHLKQDRRKKSTLQEQVTSAENLSKKNGGIVPGSTWLFEHNYSALYKAMRKHPEAFAHIPRKKAA